MWSSNQISNLCSAPNESGMNAPKHLDNVIHFIHDWRKHPEEQISTRISKIADNLITKENVWYFPETLFPTKFVDATKKSEKWEKMFNYNQCSFILKIPFWRNSFKTLDIGVAVSCQKIELSNLIWHYWETRRSILCSAVLMK